MVTIRFIDGRKSIEIDAETIGEAVETALSDGVDLRGADLRGACLTGVDLRGADLSHADLRGADLTGVDLRGACLTDADLRRACLTDANLSDADVSYAELIGADLTGVDLSRADLSRADLTGADLRGACLTGADLDYSCFPIWCGSLTVKIDKRVFCQLLYHTLRAGQSVDDPEVKKLFAVPEVVALANQFHRVEECGKIKTESD